MLTCLQCHSEFSPPNENRRIASISGSIMGDEYTETYYLCERCGTYTVEVAHEPFMGDEKISYKGPVSREKGDAAVNLIKECSEPWNKNCRCRAHITYFDGALD